MAGLIFDSGELIALDRGDRRVLVLLARAAERAMRATVPTTALAQALRNPARQARIMRLIRQSSTDLVHLDGPDAVATGVMLATSGTADIVDAHVAVCARRSAQAVITSDPFDIQRLAPELRLVVV